MTFNKNIILGILLSEFSENIESEIAYCVLDMDGYELEHIFGQLIDFAYLDDIGDVEVDSFETQTDKQETEISGVLKAEVFLEGYVHWDGEDEFVDSGETVMKFRFSFIKEGKSFSRFEMHHV